MPLAAVYLKRDDVTRRVGYVTLALCVVDAILLCATLGADNDARDRSWFLFMVQLSLSTVYAPLNVWNGMWSSKTWRLWKVWLAKVCCVVLSTAMIDLDTDSSAAALVIVTLCLYFVELVLILGLLLRSLPIQKDAVWTAVESRREHLEQTVRSIHGITRVFHENAERRAQAGDAPDPKVQAALRELDDLVYKEDMKRATHLSLKANHFSHLVLAVLAISATAFFFEMTKLVSNQNPMYLERHVQEMRDEAGDGRLPEDARLHNTNRVLIVVMDGLRYDHLDLMKFWEKSSYQDSCGDSCVDPEDIAEFHMRAQLPSMSVPNWLTILTGAPPEVTGIVGNMLAPDTFYDSIYSSAQTADVMRMVTGTPWFAAIIGRTLPFLRGDGTIDAGYTTGETTLSTSAPADRARQQVALQAIAATDDPYGLMLVHFSDIDSQGHAEGVTTEFNEDDTYVTSVNEKTEFLQELMHAVDDDTVVVMVSDHGHIDRGGHGGIAEVLLDVPAVFYRSGSGLRQPTNAWLEANDDASIDNLDIAPTVCALLGVNVPGQNHGRFVEPVLRTLVPEVFVAAHSADLFAQKHALFSKFDEYFGTGLAAQLPARTACSEALADGADDCSSQIDAAIELYFDEMRPAANTQNYALGILVILVVSGASCVLLECTEPASPLSVVIGSRRAADVNYTSCTCCASRSKGGGGVSGDVPQPIQVRKVESDLVVESFTPPREAYFRKRISAALDPVANLVSGAVEHRSPVGAQSAAATPLSESDAARRKNIVALAFGFGSVTFYFVVSIVIYVIAVLSDGYIEWDSTQIHSPQAVPTYLALVLIPSTIVAFVMIRSYSVYYHHREEASERKQRGIHCGILIYRLFRDNAATFKDPVMVYLCDVYLQFATVQCSLIALLLVCDWSFVFSTVHQIPFITDDSWAYRFRVITVLGFNLPLALSAIYKTWTWRWGSVRLEDYEKFLDLQCLPPPSVVEGDGIEEGGGPEQASRRLQQRLGASGAVVLGASDGKDDDDDDLR